MKTSLDTLEGLNRKLNIEIPKEQVTEAFTKMYRGLQRNATIKGFRKGKAPLLKVRAIYQEKVKSDVLQNLITDGYQFALSEHKLEPISQPKLNFEKFEDGNEFSFSAEFEIRPSIELKTYEKLKLQKESLVIPEEEVEKAIDNILQSRQVFEDVLEVRPLKMGDIAILDFEGLMDGQPLEGGSAKDHSLELGSNQFIPGFEEALQGLSVGDQKDIELKFPEEYHNNDIAGKPVTFKVKINKQQKKVVPELDDDFAQQINAAFKTAEDLKESVRKDIINNEENRIKEDLKGRVLKALVEVNPVEVPTTLWTRQKAALIQDVEQRMRQQGMSDQELSEYKNKWDGDFNETAKFMIQSNFLVDALADKLKLVATTGDIKGKLEEQAKMTGLDFARIEEYYNGSPERKSHLAYQITEEKVVDYLIDKAEVKEVSADKIDN